MDIIVINGRVINGRHKWMALDVNIKSIISTYINDTVMPKSPHSNSSHISQQYVPYKTFLLSNSLQPQWHSPYRLVIN
jgi:hypothetical protein